MSASSKSAVSTTTGESWTDAPPVAASLFSDTAMRANIGILEYSRTCAAAAAGMTSGILGLTGFAGFAFFIVLVLIQAVFWETKAAFRWNIYFFDRTLSVTYSFVGALFTYVLFWVFLYGIVHVY